VGILDSFGALVSSIVASIGLSVFAIVSVFVTVFIVEAGAGWPGTRRAATSSRSRRQSSSQGR